MSYRLDGDAVSIPVDCDYVYGDEEDLTTERRKEIPKGRSRSEFKDTINNRWRPFSGERPLFSDRYRSDSPSGHLGENILSRLKNQLRRDGDMFSRSPELRSDPFHRADDSDDWTRKSFEEMRSRHPMFRMPDWMSEDDDMSNLASRMSQAPHFATVRRGGPWRERRHSGGSGVSGTSDDSVDGPHTHRQESTPITIPIRIEAEAPPGCVPYQEQPKQPEQTQQQQEPQEQLPQPDKENDSVSVDPKMCAGLLHKQPQYASKTTSAIDSLQQEEVPRNTRSSSAPPEVKDKVHQQKFVSNCNITPQISNEKPRYTNSPVFNNSPKPFVATHKTQETPTIREEQNEQTEPILTETGCNDQHKIQQHPEQQGPKQHCQYPEPGKQREEQQQNPHQYQYAEPHNQYPHHYQYPEPQTEHQENPQKPHYYPGQQEQKHYQYPERQEQASQPQWGSGGHKSSVVRNIPILIEGRDDGFVKETNSPSRSPPQQQTQHPRQQHHQQSNWNRPFGSSSFGYPPSQGFTQSDPFFDFPSKTSHHQMPQYQQQQQQTPFHTNQYPEESEHFQKQQQQHQQQQHPQSYKQPPPQQQTHPQQVPQPQYHHQEPQQPEAPKVEQNVEEKDFKMDAIARVKEYVAEYQEKARKFKGGKKDKEYLYLDEMLTRALLQLDNIDPDGRDDVRQARRALIKDINNSIGALEKIAKGFDQLTASSASICASNAPEGEPLAEETEGITADQLQSLQDNKMNTTTIENPEDCEKVENAGSDQIQMDNTSAVTETSQVAVTENPSDETSGNQKANEHNVGLPENPISSS